MVVSPECIRGGSSNVGLIQLPSGFAGDIGAAGGIAALIAGTPKTIFGEGAAIATLTRHRIRRLNAAISSDGTDTPKNG